MYPELQQNIDYSYIYSSRNCFTNTKTNNYKKYIEYYLNKKYKKLLLIDIFGSGTTFLQFSFLV